MKKTQLSHISWGRVLLTGLVVYVSSYLIVILIITIYAFILAFQAQGAPDQAQINEFAIQVSPWGVPVLAVLLTFGAAFWVLRKVAASKSLHGLLIGFMVAIISVIISIITGLGTDILDLMWFFLTMGAGWFGGHFSHCRLRQV